MNALMWMMIAVSIVIWSALCLFIAGLVLCGIGWVVYHIRLGVLELVRALQKLRRARHNLLKHRLKQLKKLRREVLAELKLAPSNTQLKSLLETIDGKIERYKTSGDNFSKQQIAAESLRDKLRLVVVSTEDEINSQDTAVRELAWVEAPFGQLRSIR